jgi:hypothetical protein
MTVSLRRGARVVADADLPEHPSKLENVVFETSSVTHVHM